MQNRGMSEWGIELNIKMTSLIAVTLHFSQMDLEPMCFLFHHTIQWVYSQIQDLVKEYKDQNALAHHALSLIQSFHTPTTPRRKSPNEGPNNIKCQQMYKKQQMDATKTNLPNW